MEVTLLQKNKDLTGIIGVIKGVQSHYVNALRRFMMDYVPTMAIEKVEFIKNNSILYDEVIAHRLSLLVLRTNLADYIEKEKVEGGGDGDSRCEVRFTLKARGPCTVYASDLKSNDPKTKPIFPKTPIVKLLADQELELTATAQLGRGMKHAKWSTGLVHYRNRPKMGAKDMKKLEDVWKKQPQARNTIKPAKATLPKELIVSAELNENFIDSIRDAGIGVSELDNEFIFTIESWGAMNCKGIGLKAAELFNEELDSLQKEAKKIK